MSPVVWVNPRGDLAFVAEVDRLAAGTTDLERLQALLRERYPMAVVRERGLSEEDPAVWYVYRDGSWVDG